MPIFQLSKLEKGNVSPQSGKHFLVRLAHVSAFFFSCKERAAVCNALIPKIESVFKMNQGADLPLEVLK